MFYIYALFFKNDKRIYVGMSANPLTRKKYHEKGKVRSTKNRGDFMQKIIDKAQSREEAREKEKYWKSGCGKERLRKMVNSFSNK